MNFPSFPWVKAVNSRTLKADFWAGLTGAVVALPQGVAFATIAGMPPEYGLYAGIIPAMVAALLGSSWYLVSGPTTAASIVLFSVLSNLAPPGSYEYVSIALTLTLMVGVFELLMGIFRLGVVVNFISHSVIIGFTAGAAILIAFNQAKNFLGIEVAKGAHLHEIILAIYQQHQGFSHPSILIGAVTLLSAVIIRKFWRHLPYMIIALFLGSLTGVLLQKEWGLEIATVGALPASLPPLSAPSFDLGLWQKLTPAAMALTLFALTEAVSISRALAAKGGQMVDGDREFIAQGFSNIVGSFFSAYLATGSFNRSGLNYEAGAKTPLAAFFAGGLLAIVVLIAAPWAAYLPNAAMAGILLVVAWGLIDFHHIKQILQTSKGDSAVLLVTFLIAIFWDLEIAIFSGVMLSLLLYLQRTSKPSIWVRVPDPHNPRRKFTTNSALPECPQLKIIRIDGSLFFGAVTYFQESLARFKSEKPGQKHLIIVCLGMNFLDAAGAEALANEAKKRQEEGGGLYLIRLKEGARAPLERGGYIEKIGENNIFQSKDKALGEICAKLDPEICRTCPHRVFRECAKLGGRNE